MPPNSTLDRIELSIEVSMVFQRMQENMEIQDNLHR